MISEVNAKLIGLFSGFPTHHFTDEITEVLHENLSERQSLVFISAWPDAYEQNNNDSDGMHIMFAERGMAFDEHLVIDQRTTPSDAADAVRKADCVFLMGGDPTLQIRLIRNLGLDLELQKSEAVILGVSAGAMNIGRYVADVWETKAWYEGLGLTDISIKAHYSEKESDISILKELSMLHPVTVMEDESAIFLKGKLLWKFGNIHRIEKGKITALPTNRDLKRQGYGTQI